MQSFTKPVGNGSKSDDLHGADRTRRRTSASVTWDRLCRTSLVFGGVNTFEHEPEEKEDRMMEILFMKKNLKVFANAVIEQRYPLYLWGSHLRREGPAQTCLWPSHESSSCLSYQPWTRTEVFAAPEIKKESLWLHVCCTSAELLSSTAESKTGLFSRLTPPCLHRDHGCL